METDNKAPIASGGWQIGTGFAASVPQSQSRRFYAVYEGGAFGHPERGIVAAIARGHEAGSGNIKGANDAAQLVVHSFAEGYFGARRTLGAKRAAHLALNSINSWLYGQTNIDNRHLVPVSLTALLFYGNSVGVVHVGRGRLFRWRAGVVSPLMRDDQRAVYDASETPDRAIGLDLELSVDFEDIDARPGDRFLLISGLESDRLEAAETAFALQLPDSGADVSAIVLDVVAAPTPDPQKIHGDLADLPLRPAPREGDVWDGFVIGKTVYRGRYTLIKIARDTIENREVVLKIPLAAMLQDEVFTAGFMREAWIGSTVRGHNVARYIELPPERRSSLYLVMPYYRGETLEARLNRAPPMPLPDGIGIAIKLCEAVQDLAAIQIIHRDLKPDNIILLPDNEVRLLDLGLAYLPGIDVRDVVKPGGTLRYMAPELLRGVQANPRSEVYSLAVTLYRMFSGGAYPFGQREAVPLKRMRPDLPSWLGRILQQALLAPPSERFADAGELAKSLYEGLVTGIEDTPKPPRFRLTKLQTWQAAAAFFAIGFFVLLARTLR